MTYTLIQGDCIETMRGLPANSVQCCVTSPPYYGLRNYEGGDAEIGKESTTDEYVSKLVDVFREVRRLLKDDGTCWINLGDSYNGSGKGPTGYNDIGDQHERQGFDSRATKVDGLKPKDLIGIPWMVAFALRADGWWLRSDIIWSKPNPMPESVTDRPTKSHEYIFLLSKSQRYFYDADAIREPNAGDLPYGDKVNFKMNDEAAQGRHGKSSMFAGGSRQEYIEKYYTNGRNRRSVWTVTTKPYSGAHFATMPTKLVEPCILAGSRVGDTVIDPFNGSGTTGAVALKHGRKYIGCELNADYIELAHERIRRSQPVLFEVSA